MKKRYFVQHGYDSDLKYIGRFKNKIDACMSITNSITKNTFVLEQSELWLTKKEIKNIISNRKDTK